MYNDTQKLLIDIDSEPIIQVNDTTINTKSKPGSNERIISWDKPLQRNIDLVVSYITYIYIYILYIIIIIIIIIRFGFNNRVIVEAELIETITLYYFDKS